MLARETPAPPAPFADPTSPAHLAFTRLILNAGLRTDDPWVTGYVDYEWAHLRLVAQAYGIVPHDLRILEFGCNVGGSLITMAALGAEVVGVDIDPTLVEIANANVARYGYRRSARAVPMRSSRRIPAAAGAFDLVLAASVLEYVDPEDLDAIIGEFRRVLRPGGLLLICGTASRLAPRETHSGQWLVNYLPRRLDAVLGRDLQRGLSPVRLLRSLRGRFEQVNPESWIEARRLIHGGIPAGARTLWLLSRVLAISPGWLAPNLELLLRKIR